MTTIPAFSFSLSASIPLLYLLCFSRLLAGLGGGDTIAVTYSSTSTVCGIIANEQNRRIECLNSGETVFILPNISYDSIAGGGSYFCGVRSGGNSLVCWDTTRTNWGVFTPKRIYYNLTNVLRQISIGDDQICGIINGSNELTCWRGMTGYTKLPYGIGGFRMISSGLGFSCGILLRNYSAICWGSNSTLAGEIQHQFVNISLSSIVAGSRHVCGFSLIGSVVCKGNNEWGQLNVPGRSAGMSESYSKLALGSDFSCGIRTSNGSVVCWGGRGQYSSNVIKGVSFETIVAGSNLVCGLVSADFSVVCWGPGWNSSSGYPDPGIINLPLPPVLPGECVSSELPCDCGVYPDSKKFCSSSGIICRPCPPGLPSPSPISPPPSRPASKSQPRGRLRKDLLALAIVGSVGTLAGIAAIIIYCCLCTGVPCGRKKVHNSVQPTITRNGSNAAAAGAAARTPSNSPPVRSLTIRRQISSRAMRRSRSGTSSMKHHDRAEEFSLSELAAATNDFSLENKIGAGSFGVVYRGKLSDGREVAVKRGEPSTSNNKMNTFQEKESAFESELAFLSRLHHKHLVRLVGYCEERDERLLVYEYMKNGALYDHLHDTGNIEKGSSVLNSWKMRIRIVLNAARGIEYLHNYAVPPIIHRDIKSSNILLDANWTARVSDFGLSLFLMGRESDCEFRPLKAAGTVGYMDPEYYSLNVLTTKSDVYGLGVVLLELLTGKRAIFKHDHGSGRGRGGPMSVVDYAVPAIMSGELDKILDPRVGPLASNESEAVELVSFTAMHCVNLEGKDRPTMTDVVANLERALAICEDSHGNISSASISLGSE